MIEIILEDLNNKEYMATNISVEKLYNDVYKNGSLYGRAQRDGAGINAKKKLPEICFSRSDFLPQKTGELPTQNLKLGQLIKVVLKMDAVKKLRGIKKAYPVSYGNANKEKAGDTESRGEERLQIDRIPATRKYMTIYIPHNLFQEDIEYKGGIIPSNRNANVAKLMEKDPEFQKWVEANLGEGELFQYYKDTSRPAYYRALKLKKELEEKKRKAEEERAKQKKKISYFNY